GRIPEEWGSIKKLHLVVSVDGLSTTHDTRLSPATDERILKHIAGHRITVHCTITRSQVQRPGYLSDFASFWSEREEVRNIWFSLFTPQEGEQGEGRLHNCDREMVIGELARLRDKFPKVKMPRAVLESCSHPPAPPREFICARTAVCISADLVTQILLGKFGGQPVCAECGCMASAGLASIG